MREDDRLSIRRPIKRSYIKRTFGQALNTAGRIICRFHFGGVEVCETVFLINNIYILFLLLPSEFSPALLIDDKTCNLFPIRAPLKTPNACFAVGYGIGLTSTQAHYKQLRGTVTRAEESNPAAIWRPFRFQISVVAPGVLNIGTPVTGSHVDVLLKL